MVPKMDTLGAVPLSLTISSSWSRSFMKRWRLPSLSRTVCPDLAVLSALKVMEDEMAPCTSRMVVDVGARNWLSMKLSDVSRFLGFFARMSLWTSFASIPNTLM